ncbi:MAG: carboxypeptidase regulatory-like domain-containing protein [Bryobacteraceae bacterium]
MRFIALSCCASSFGASLTGIVHDPTKAPLAGAIALLQSETDFGQRQVLRTDDQGRYQFDNLAEGKYKLELQMAGFASKLIRSIDVQSGDQTTMPIITLELGLDGGGCGLKWPLSISDIRLLPAGTSGGSLAGSIQGREDAALAGVRVLLVCSENTYCAESRTNRQGEFTFAQLTPGTYAVMILRTGFYPRLEIGLKVRPDLEVVYRPIRIQECHMGNCDPAMRPKLLPPEPGHPVVLCQD